MQESIILKTLHKLVGGGQYNKIPGTENKYGGPDYEGPKSSISEWADDFDKEFIERAEWSMMEE